MQKKVKVASSKFGHHTAPFLNIINVTDHSRLMTSILERNQIDNPRTALPQTRSLEPTGILSQSNAMNTGDPTKMALQSFPT